MLRLELGTSRTPNSSLGPITPLWELPQGDQISVELILPLQSVKTTTTGRRKLGEGEADREHQAVPEDSPGDRDAPAWWEGL